jgi:hypothetical protein
VILSLNEIEATILKAARGAGMEWGLAEEAAQAVRFLARRGIRFEAAFLHLCEAAPWRADIVLDAASLRPRDAEAWLCPIRVGACLSDLTGALPLRIERVLQPLLLLPFAARLDAPAALAWEDVGLTVRTSEIAARLDDAPVIWPDRAETVAVVTGGALASTEPKGASFTGGAEIDRTVWAKLQVFEKCTYVPASLRSRALGAGSKASDND